MLKRLSSLLLLISATAFATPTVLVDAIPTDASFINYAAVKVPITDLSQADPTEIEQGLASSISWATPDAVKDGASYICLLSAAGDHPRSFTVGAASSSLKLRTKNSSFVIVLYGGGTTPTPRVTYSLDKPDPNRAVESEQLTEIVVPKGWDVAAWVYFNLPKIQAKALKAGASQIFLEASGQGPKTGVVIPGLKEPLMIPTGETVLTASWYTQKQGDQRGDREPGEGIRP
jgi:hypothetical protein